MNVETFMTVEFCKTKFALSSNDASFETVEIFFKKKFRLGRDLNPGRKSSVPPYSPFWAALYQEAE